MSKKLSKEKLDKVIILTGKWLDAHKEFDYDESVSVRLLTNAYDALEELIPDQNWEFPKYAFADIISGCIRAKVDCTNQDIYKVLEVLGWQVVADEQAEH